MRLDDRVRKVVIEASFIDEAIAGAIVRIIQTAYQFDSDGTLFGF